MILNTVGALPWMGAHRNRSGPSGR